MTEAEFEREASHLFRELGLKLAPDALNFFQSDTPVKHDWKSGLKKPSPTATRRVRPRSVVTATSKLPPAKAIVRKVSAPVSPANGSAAGAPARQAAGSGERGQQQLSPSKAAVAPTSGASTSSANGHTGSTSFRRLSTPPRSPGTRRRQLQRDATDGCVTSKPLSAQTQQQKPRREILKPQQHRNAAERLPPSAPPSTSPASSSPAAGTPLVYSQVSHSNKSVSHSNKSVSHSSKSVGHSRSKSESWKHRSIAPASRIPSKFSPPVSRRHAVEPAGVALHNGASSELNGKLSRKPAYPHTDKRSGPTPPASQVDKQSREPHATTEQTERKQSTKSSELSNTQVLFNRKSSLQLLSVATSSKSSIVAVVDRSTPTDQPKKKVSPREGERTKQPDTTTETPSAKQRESGIPTLGSMRPRVLSAPKSSALASRIRPPHATSTTTAPQAASTAPLATLKPAHPPLGPRTSSPAMLSTSAPQQERSATSYNRAGPPVELSRKSSDVISPPPLPVRRSSEPLWSPPSSTSSSLSRGSTTSPVPELTPTRSSNTSRASQHSTESTDGSSQAGSDSGSWSASRLSMTRSSTTPELTSGAVASGGNGRELHISRLEEGPCRSSFEDLRKVSTVAISTVQALGNLVEALTPAADQLGQRYVFPGPSMTPPPGGAQVEPLRGERTRKTGQVVLPSPPSHIPLSLSATSPPLPPRAPVADISPPLPPRTPVNASPPLPPRTPVDASPPPPLPPRTPSITPPPPPPRTPTMTTPTSNRSSASTSPNLARPSGAVSSEFSGDTSPSGRAGTGRTSSDEAVMNGSGDPDESSRTNAEPPENLLEDCEDEDFFGYCRRCGDAVIGLENGCLAVDAVYHLSCFTCSLCHTSLLGENFYTVKNEVVCEKDYMNILERCYACRKIIRDRVLRAAGRVFHPACFRCAVCAECLDGVPFTSDSTRRVYCIRDYHRVFAPKCAACRQPIIPDEGQAKSVRIIAMDKCFHVECYKCEGCGLQLANQSSEEHTKCYPLDHHLLCLLCHTSWFSAIASRTTAL